MASGLFIFSAIQSCNFLGGFSIVLKQDLELFGRDRQECYPSRWLEFCYILLSDCNEIPENKHSILTHVNWWRIPAGTKSFIGVSLLCMSFSEAAFFSSLHQGMI